MPSLSTSRAGLWGMRRGVDRPLFGGEEPGSEDAGYGGMELIDLKRPRLSRLPLPTRLSISSARCSVLSFSSCINLNKQEQASTRHQHGTRHWRARRSTRTVMPSPQQRLQHAALPHKCSTFHLPNRPSPGTGISPASQSRSALQRLLPPAPSSASAVGRMPLGADALPAGQSCTTTSHAFQRGIGNSDTTRLKGHSPKNVGVSRCLSL